MNPLVFTLAALAGGVGAALRLFLDGAIRQRWGSWLPFGTLTINVTGSLGLGLLAGLATHVLPAQWLLILGTGVMGGFTTFSTAGVETVRLIQAGRWPSALVTGLGMLTTALVCAGAGFWAGSPH